MSTEKDELRTIVAAHEIGHVLLLLKVGNTLKRAEANHNYGFTTCAEEHNPTGKAGQLVLMGGPAAEALWLHEHYRSEFSSWSKALSWLLNDRCTKTDRKMFKEAKGPLSQGSAANKALTHIKSDRRKFTKLTEKLARKRRITSWDL